LYGEPALNVTEEADLAVFTTSFGATFGTFTCMDLLFYNPAVRLVKELNVTDIAFPTAWFSELPFLTGKAILPLLFCILFKLFLLFAAVQAQSGWALGLGVNFLGSGYNHPAVGNSGSGIYSAETGPVEALMAQEAGTTLLIATVPLNPKKSGNLFYRLLPII
jgi:pantetheine hydrolase